MPEPCSPAIRITVGPLLAIASSLPVPPISPASSSLTIFTTCWPGSRLFNTSSPRQRSLTVFVKVLTTLKLTSASSRARRMSRIAASTSDSLSLPRERTSERVDWRRSESWSNTGAQLRGLSGEGSGCALGELRARPLRGLSSDVGARPGGRAETGLHFRRFAQFAQSTTGSLHQHSLRGLAAELPSGGSTPERPGVRKLNNRGFGPSALQDHRGVPWGGWGYPSAGMSRSGGNAIRYPRDL